MKVTREFHIESAGNSHNSALSLADSRWNTTLCSKIAKISGCQTVLSKNSAGTRHPWHPRSIPEEAMSGLDHTPFLYPERVVDRSTVTNKGLGQLGFFSDGQPEKNWVSYL